ncbi:MAG: hypothetical protein EA425_06615 [Puniceicoccaceae bacterium]|nr:MAG: hypothetical protein EA425_06615 [Puniceicoccaceae bacterium]
MREFVLDRKPDTEPQIIRRGEELEEVVAVIRENAADRLRERVQLLAGGRERMAANYRIINNHLQPFQEAQSRNAALRLSVYAEDLLLSQEAVTAALRVYPETLRGEPLVDEARRRIARILRAQDEVRRGIFLLRDGEESLLALQDEAEEHQFAAGNALRLAMEGFARIERLRNESATLRERAARQAATVSAHEAAAAEAAATFAASEEALEKLRRRIADGAAIDNPDHREREARQQLDQHRRQLESAQRDLRNRGNELARTHEDLARREAEIESARQDIARRVSEALAAQTRAHRTQAGVLARLDIAPHPGPEVRP